MYVLLFPQLLLIIHWKKYCNSYGSIVSMIMGFVFRILGMCMQLNQMLMKLLDYLSSFHFHRGWTSSGFARSPGIPVLRWRIGPVISLSDLVHDHSSSVSRSCITTGSLHLQKRLSFYQMGPAWMFWRFFFWIVGSSKIQNWRREDNWRQFQLSNEQRLIRGDHISITIWAHQQVFNAGTLAGSNASRRSQSCIFLIEKKT